MFLMIKSVEVVMMTFMIPALLCVFVLKVSLVEAQVTIIKQPSNLTACNGGEAVFSCVIRSPGIARNIITTVNWQMMIINFGFVSVVNNDHHVIHQTVRNDTLTERLIITNVSMNDNGVLYRCMVTESVISNIVSILLAASPTILPTIAEVQPLTSTSFIVNWTPSHPNYNYTVIWTNLHTGVMYNRTVPENTNSYTVTGLSGDVNYNVSVAAVNKCGMMTSDPVTVYDAPNRPQFAYCVSYQDHPTLQIFTQVTVNVPRMSLMLQFLASYQTGTPTVTDATCSDMQNDMRYNCTVEFTVDIIPSVEIMQSVNVTVSGPYGSSSSTMEVEERFGSLLGVTQGEMLENSAELVCTLACFSPNIHCKLSKIAIDGNKCELTPNYTSSSISGSSNSYDYPTQKIIIYDLASGNRYNYCITGVSVSNDEIVDVGEPICGSFTTSAATSKNEDESSSSSSSNVVAMVATISCSLTFILTLTITAIITFIATYMCMKQKPDVISNQIQPAQKAFYEEISPPHVTNPQNSQNSVYDTSCRQASQNLKNSSSENGYELMASVRIQKDLDNTAPSHYERVHEASTECGHYVQIMKHPIYNNITPGQAFSSDDGEGDNSTCNTSQ